PPDGRTEGGRTAGSASTMTGRLPEWSDSGPPAAERRRRSTTRSAPAPPAVPPSGQPAAGLRDQFHPADGRRRAGQPTVGCDEGEPTLLGECDVSRVVAANSRPELPHSRQQTIDRDVIHPEKGNTIDGLQRLRLADLLPPREPTHH